MVKWYVLPFLYTISLPLLTIINHDYIAIINPLFTIINPLFTIINPLLSMINPLLSMIKHS
jgi:hypothetical protein